MKTALQTVKDEYGTNNPEAVLSVTVNRFAEIMRKFAEDSCDEQKANCSRIQGIDGETMLKILSVPLPKHLLNV